MWHVRVVLAFFSGKVFFSLFFCIVFFFHILFEYSNIRTVGPQFSPRGTRARANPSGRTKTINSKISDLYIYIYIYTTITIASLLWRLCIERPLPNSRYESHNTANGSNPNKNKKKYTYRQYRRAWKYWV